VLETLCRLLGLSGSWKQMNNTKVASAHIRFLGSSLQVIRNHMHFSTFIPPELTPCMRPKNDIGRG